MKKHKISLFARTAAFFLLFSVLTTLLAALLQSVLLPEIYEKTKKDAMHDTLTSVISGISQDQAGLQSICSDAAVYYGTCIIVTDKNGTVIASAQGNSVCALHHLNRTQLEDLASQAARNGGSLVSRIDVSLPDRPDIIFGQNTARYGSKKALKSLLSVTIVTSDIGTDKVIYVNSVTSPVNDITRTNRILLGIVLVVMTVLSVVMAILFSGSFSRPVVEMNREAKKLGNGHFDVLFEEETGIKELDELGSSLNGAAKELGKVDHLRTELLANVSHDLRTPLTLITGYSEMMRDLPGENNEENLNVIISEAKRLSSLVNDVLDISKYRSGAIEIHPVDFSITQEIRSVIERLKLLDDESRFEFRFYPRSDAFVHADQNAIERVLYNLTLNAVNYSTSIALVEIHQTVQDNSVKIEIIDHGAGIRQEELPYVFDRYYRSSDPHKRSVMGTGLGLSIVKSILEAHDAQFGVISSPGSGSDFWFTLPVSSKKQN